MEASIDDMELATLKCTYTEPFDPSIATAWPQDVLDTFADLIDGHEIPFFYMGTKAPTVTTSSSSYTFRIDGGTYNDQIETLAKAAFNGDSWTVTDNTSTSSYDYDVFDATKDFADGCALKATLTKSGSSSTAKAQLEVTISEAWDPTKYTDWPDDIKTEMTTYYGEVLPYVYLGTGAPVKNFYSSYSNELDLKGGTWNDAVLDSVKTQLQADTEHTWTYTDETGSYSTRRVFIGTPTDPTKNSWKLKLYKNYSGYIILEIFQTSVWNPASCSDWEDDLKTEMTTNFGEVVPYFYLGTATPTWTWYSSNTELDITGGSWNDQVYDSVNTQLQADTEHTWTFEDEYDYYYDDSVRVFTGAPAVAGASTWTIKLYENYSSKILAEITHKEGFKPNSDTEWQTETLNAFTSNLDDHKIPYFYIGNTVTVNISNPYGVDLTGGPWSNDVIPLAEAALDADTVLSWTHTTSTDSTGKTSLTASATAADGCVIDLKIAPSSDKIKVTATYCPAGTDHWLDDVKTAINSYTGNHDHADEVPYVYFNNPAPTATEKTDHLLIQGGAYVDGDQDKFNAVYGAAGWTLTSKGSSWGDYAEKLFDDGCKIRVMYDWNSVDVYGTGTSIKSSQLKIYYTEPNPQNGSWSTAIQTEMTNRFTEVIPFVYLNSSAPTMGSWSSSYRSIEITGDVWDDQILTYASDAFSGLTEWETQTGKNLYGKVFAARKFLADGSSIRVIVAKDGSSATAKACMQIFLDPAATATTETDWSDSAKTTMQTYLNGNVIPFMYLGTSNAGLTYDSSSRCLKIDHPTGFSSWKNQYLDAAKAALDADGYTTKLNFFDPYRSNWDEGMVLDATKAVAGGTISIHLDYSLCLVSYAAEYTLPAEEDRVWSSDVTTALNSTIGGNTIPYLYLGDEVKVTTGTDKVTLTGNTWGDQFFDNAIASFTADTTKTWTYAKAIINSKQTLVLTAVDPNDATKMIQVNIYASAYDSTGRYPMKWAVVEISYVDAF